MKKQTAVEWVIEQLPLIQQEGLRDIFEQAKGLEKQQIIDAYGDAEYNLYLTGKDYFEQTFKKN